MMWIPIITSLVCFAVATILFTPPLRKFPFYQAVSFYFLFEGAWTLFNTLITAIWPYADFMIWVHHVGIILFAGYLFYKIYVYYWRQRREEKRETEQAAGEKELSKENDEEKMDIAHCRLPCCNAAWRRRRVLSAGERGGVRGVAGCEPQH